MATKSDIDANSHTLNSGMETVTAIFNLSHWLQSKRNEIHRLNVQLSLYQRMPQDARKEISQLKKNNKELKRRKTTMARFTARWCSSFDD
ncbi:hypothetical protein ACSBR1_038237 [Camellia fascicularis]